MRKMRPYVSKALAELRNELERGIREGEAEVQKRRRDEVPGEWAQGVVDCSRRILGRIDDILNPWSKDAQNRG